MNEFKKYQKESRHVYPVDKNRRKLGTYLLGSGALLATGGSYVSSRGNGEIEKSEEMEVPLQQDSCAHEERAYGSGAAVFGFSGVAAGLADTDISRRGALGVFGGTLAAAAVAHHFGEESGAEIVEQQNIMPHLKEPLPAEDLGWRAKLAPDKKDKPTSIV